MARAALWFGYSDPRCGHRLLLGLCPRGQGEVVVTRWPQLWSVARWRVVGVIIVGRADMEGHAHPKGTASETLDRIRRGGTHLILAAQRWLGETKTLLDDGDFQGAMKTAAQLHEKIAALAVAEGSLGTVSDARILKCRDVEIGMTLAEVGEVTAIEPCPCGQDHCDRIVLTIDERPVNFPADAEIIVAAYISQ
jgi:hypothetical protein